MSEIRKVRNVLREMVIDRRHVDDRRDVPRGGRRKDDALLSARDVLAACAREEFIAINVLARALKTSRKVLLRDWESRRYPTTRIGLQILLASSFVLRAYFPHATQAITDHPGHQRPNEPTEP